MFGSTSCTETSLLLSWLHRSLNMTWKTGDRALRNSWWPGILSSSGPTMKVTSENASALNSSKWDWRTGLEWKLCLSSSFGCWTRNDGLNTHILSIVLRWNELVFESFTDVKLVKLNKKNFKFWKRSLVKSKPRSDWSELLQRSHRILLHCQGSTSISA